MTREDLTPAQIAHRDLVLSLNVERHNGVAWKSRRPAVVDDEGAGEARLDKLVREVEELAHKLPNDGDHYASRVKAAHRLRAVPPIAS